MADGTTDAGNGITGGYEEGNPIILQAMMAFTAISWYNAVELIVLVLVVFKTYSGAYFWSLLIASAAIVPYSAGAWAKQVGISNSIAMIALSNIGWIVMVPGQSMVLWSRLHCLTQDQRLLKGILIMIIVDAFVLTVPTAVLSFGSNSDKAHLFVTGYAVMEKIQMTVFTLQELLISSIYIVEVRRVLSVIYDGRFRKMMFELIAINVVIIIMDVALLGLEYVSLYQIEVTLKGMVYSIKLKLEFGVLSKLVKIATAHRGVYNLDTADTTLGSKETTTNLGGLVTTTSPVTTTGTDSTYATSRTLNPPTEPRAVTEKYCDFEPNVSFSQPEPMPKPVPQQQGLSRQSLTVSRNPSIQDLYPGRLS